jgi:uncharacterized repeat protein (TIGR01451 family)
MTVSIGARITYTLAITNSGDAEATGLVITDALPIGAHYVQGGILVGDVISWTVGYLAEGNSTAVQFVVTATQTITNWAYGVRADGAPDPGYSAAGTVAVVTVIAGYEGDSYEVDDTCTEAGALTADGSVQTHTFHDAGDVDWGKFYAEAGKTYIISVHNVGERVDPVVMLYDACDDDLPESDDDIFGPAVKMEWDCFITGEYYVKLMQTDQAVYSDDTYDLAVGVDTEPPSSPRNLRITPANQALIVQWERSPERDVVGYRIRWGTHSGGPYGNVHEITGAEATYYQITGLSNGVAIYIVVQALDFSGNASDPSVEVGEVPSETADPTVPTIALRRPTVASLYTTTVAALTIGGVCTDTGENLSRVHVQNLTTAGEGWDYGLSGMTATFAVEGITLTEGLNNLQITVYDMAVPPNTAIDGVMIRRLTGQTGAVVIVGGHNNGYSLQNRIDYATNRAYRVFQSAGFTTGDIRYLSPSPQDADDDGVSDVFSATTPANVQAAIQWAATRVGPDTPFYLYLMDHGLTEAFCADGCSSAGRISPEALDTWLDELETTSGCNLVTVIIEACHSGSFLDRVEDVSQSISEDGRVVIVSTGRANNAYASAQGAYFSDAFFSSVAESSHLLMAFNQAKVAVETTGNNQTPWLDDNGDGLYNAADGARATNRYIASYFGTLIPKITAASVSVEAGVGTIQAVVERGDEPLDIVWAAVYAPSFQEPTETTLDLDVPLIELEPKPGQAGRYTATYNGFGEEGAYRIVIYVEDQKGNQAMPKLVWIGETRVYLPLVLKQ